jgi:hypothetical protein
VASRHSPEATSRTASRSAGFDTQTEFGLFGLRAFQNESPHVSQRPTIRGRPPIVETVSRATSAICAFDGRTLSGSDGRSGAGDPPGVRTYCQVC